MESVNPKTLDDFPRVVVNAVRPGAASNTEFQRFELEVSFDPLLESRFIEIGTGDVAQWFWLLLGDRDCLTPMLKSFDKETRTATLVCDEKEEPKIIGSALAYLSPYWQAFHIWMVLDPTWGWERRQFEGVDAVAEDYEAEGVSLIAGRNNKIWTKLEPRVEGRGQSRHYPAEDQSSPIRSGKRVIPGGWGHEHCELCNKHIEAGMVGYCDPSEHWMCDNCYQRYVTRHDLAFVDEL